MGLDLLAITLRVEEEFEIMIPNEIAETIKTPRNLTDYLISLPEVSEKWSKDYVLISVWQIIENEGAIDKTKFNDDSRFIEDMGLD